MLLCKSKVMGLHDVDPKWCDAGKVDKRRNGDVESENRDSVSMDR